MRYHGQAPSAVNSLVIQWLGLAVVTADGPGSVPGRGTKIPASHVGWLGSGGEAPITSRWASRMAQPKESARSAGSLGGEHPLKEETATHSSILA